MDAPFAKVGLTFAGFVLLAGSATAPNGAKRYDTKLQQCRSEIQTRLDGLHSIFSCDWRTLRRGQPKGGLTGEYAYRRRGMMGTMTILESVGDSIRVIIETNRARLDHATCFASVHPVRGADGVLTGPAIEGNAKPVDSPGCTISITPAGLGRLKVSESQCWIAVCGVHARFDGDYRLITR